LFCAAAGSCALFAESAISLQEAAARKSSDYTLVSEGRAVAVTGQVSIKPIRIVDVFHVAIQEKGYGLVLEGTSRIFGQISPGDWVEAHGRIVQRAGLPVVVVSKIAAVSAGAPPAELPLSPAGVQNLERLGQLVVTQGEVIEVGSNFGGAYLRIGSPPNALKVFLPDSPESRQAFSGFSVGETVRVTGIAYQYCPIPPHDDSLSCCFAIPRTPFT